MTASRRSSNALALFLLILVLLLNFSFINSAGTGDLSVWLKWARQVVDYGPVAGYCKTPSDYPPGSFGVLWAFASVLGPQFIAVKTSILFFWLLYILTILLLSHRIKLPFWLGAVLASNPAIWLNAQFLGYLDIYFATFLLLARCFLYSKRLLFWSGMCIVAAILLKWQPLIILPFFPGIVWRRGREAGSPWLLLNRWIGGVLCAIGIAGAAYLLLGGTLQCTASAFWRASHHNFVSGNALNMNWIATYLLHLMWPDVYGPLVNGVSHYVETSITWLRILNMLATLSAYSFFIVLLLLRGNSLSDFCVAATGAGLSYFVFSYGVHENHLYLVVIVATYLVFLNPSDPWSLQLLAAVSLLHLVNLLIFYGLTGQVTINRVVLGVDTSLLFSVAHIVLFIIISVAAFRYIGQFHTVDDGYDG